MKRTSRLLRGKRKREEGGRELAILLDQDSVQRLERLRSRFKRLDDSELIAFALKSLERQINRIVKRRVLKRIRVLENNKLGPQQIADHLNRQGIPVPGKAGKWNDGTIARLSSSKRDV